MFTIFDLCSVYAMVCAVCDKKETGCTGTSAADTLDLHQVGNGVHVCVQVGAN